MCASNGNCIINVSTRKSCTKCRLNKCYLMGMKQQLVYKRIKLNVNNNNNNNITDLDINSNESIVSDDDWYEFTKWLDNNNNSLNRETKSDQIEKDSHVFINTVRIPQPMVDFQGLNQLQINRIDELLAASRVLQHRVSKNIIHLNSKQNILRLTQHRNEQGVRELMYSIKQLHTYSQLCANDQWSLVKHGSLDQMLIKMLYYFDTNVNNFIFYIDTNISLMIDLDDNYWSTTRHRIDSPVTKMYIKFITNLLTQCRCDPVIIVLLSAIALFNPNLPDLKYRDVIKLEQQLYIYLMQQYLQWKYRSDYDWKHRLQTIMTSLIDLQTFSNIHKRVEHNDYQQYKSYYGPLIREVYNF
ncbi:nuclear hormone receptor HR96-like [Oppia nitens]|uniref:nuclear hormone receptor HR96-like n=1 Tax=Oppia nitens TaxID=1686743 RepID=UPI0023DBB993|nr:nuclear hormone receptor HR96-like [Oppia nitens]